MNEIRKKRENLENSNSNKEENIKNVGQIEVSFSL